MAKGTVNKVIIVGRIGVNPEVRYMPSGMAVMSLSLATNDGYKHKDPGQFVDQTEWHRVTVFGQQAETLGQYTKKGDLVYVEGRIKTTKYQDKNTWQDRYSTEIVAIQTQMVGGKPSEFSKEDLPLPDYIPSHVEMPSGEPIARDKAVTPPKAPAMIKVSNSPVNAKIADNNDLTDSDWDDEPPF